MIQHLGAFENTLWRQHRPYFQAGGHPLSVIPCFENSSSSLEALTPASVEQYLTTLPLFISRNN